MNIQFICVFAVNPLVKQQSDWRRRRRSIPAGAVQHRRHCRTAGIDRRFERDRYNRRH